MADHKAVGVSKPRREGREKVTGAARYIDDVPFEGLLHGATIRSPVPRGVLQGVRFGGDIPWDEFVIATAADVPGKNVVTLFVEDQPLLAEDRINHAEEPVVLIAHPDRQLVIEARKHVHLDIAPLPPIYTIDEALAGDTVVWGEDNVQKEFLIDKGDVDSVFDAPGAELVIVEGDYATAAQEQLYIEPQGIVAKASAEDGVTVWGSLQCPYYVLKGLVPIFGLPRERVRVVQATTGGGFGGKEEYPSIIAGHAALLSWKAGGRPVKLIYDRAEDMAATTKRHPSQTRHRTALTRDGKLVAMDVDFVLDGGAYVTLTPVVLSRGVIHASGPYACEHVRVRGRAVATNLPPQGAFRGFGAPQSIFAVERHLDHCAKAVGLEPDELRRRNLLLKGQQTSTEQVIEEEIDLSALLDFALAKADWAERRVAYAAQNADPANTIKRGIGLATFYHGSGFTGSGEVYIDGEVDVAAGADGRVTVYAASTEIGQGSATIFCQIAADALGLPYESIVVAQPDTAAVPDSGPTVASRTTMVVGKLVERAARGIGVRLQEAGRLGPSWSPAAFAEACAAHLAAAGSDDALRVRAKYEAPPGIVWDDKRYRGSAYASYGWAVYVAAVAVDTVTYEARVEDFVAVQDIGTPINPILAAGQVEGGVAQGIGYALYEDVVWDGGHMVNNQMTNYIMPTAVDLPPIRVFFKPVPFEHGPSGAKGVGELPMDGPAPAILNAIEHALGVSINASPARPERIMEAVAAATRGGGAHAA